MTNFTAFNVVHLPAPNLDVQLATPSTILSLTIRVTFVIFVVFQSFWQARELETIPNVISEFANAVIKTYLKQFKVLKLFKPEMINAIKAINYNSLAFSNQKATKDTAKVVHELRIVIVIARVVLNFTALNVKILI